MSLTLPSASSSTSSIIAPPEATIALHELPDIILKEIISKLPKEDKACLGLVLTNRSLFLRSVYGVPYDRVFEIPPLNASNLTDVKLNKFWHSLKSFQNFQNSFRAQIAENVIAQLESWFAREFKVASDLFHDVLGREFIKARYPLNAENAFFLDYAGHIFTALNLAFFCPNDPIQNLLALVNFSLKDEVTLTAKSHFDRQQNVVKGIKSNYASQETFLIEGGGPKYFPHNLPVLCAFPPHIALCTHLVSLRIVEERNLHSLPPEIGKLTNLVELKLWKNGLIALPPEIGGLSKLKSLSLHDNEICTLPPSIGLLHNLQELFLANNPVIQLPNEMMNMVNLSQLTLNFCMLYHSTRFNVEEHKMEIQNLKTYRKRTKESTALQNLSNRHQLLKVRIKLFESKSDLQTNTLLSFLRTKAIKCNIAV